VSTYKEQIADRKYFVLVRDEEILGTFGNLAKVCRFMKKRGDFASYNTLSRKRDYPISYKNYVIHKVKHY